MKNPCKLNYEKSVEKILGLYTCLLILLSASCSRVRPPSPTDTPSVDTSTNQSLYTETSTRFPVLPIQNTLTPTMNRTEAVSATQATFTSSYQQFIAALPFGEYAFVSSYENSNGLLLACGLDGSQYTFFEGTPIPAPDNSFVINLGVLTIKPYHNISIVNLKSNSYVYTSLSADLMVWNSDYSSVVAWSPDNTRLAFLGYQRIAIVSSSDGNWIDFKLDPNLFIDTGTGHYLSWSPNGKWLAFFPGPYTRAGVKNIPPTRLYILDTNCIDSPDSCYSPLHLLDIGHNASSPIAWTPESNLAVSNNDIGPNNHYMGTIDVFNIPTGQIIKHYQLPSNTGAITSLAWSPYNDWIAISQDIYPGAMQILSIDGKTHKTLENCGGASFIGFYKK